VKSKVLANKRPVCLAPKKTGWQTVKKSMRRKYGGYQHLEEVMNYAKKGIVTAGTKSEQFPRSVFGTNANHQPLQGKI